MGIITVMDRAFEQVMYAMLSISICIQFFLKSTGGPRFTHIMGAEKKTLLGEKHTVLGL